MVCREQSAPAEGAVTIRPVDGDAGEAEAREGSAFFVPETPATGGGARRNP